MEAESRHKHLLEPIRDLATNWNIDLATELEDYLHELESITISFDDGETTVNFVEAALLIQGSACVYSKKVEHLYNLLYQCLEVLVDKKKAREKSSITSDGVDVDAIFNDLSYLKPLDDHLIDGKNIDLDDAKEFNYEKSRAVTLICRPPMGALDREDDEDGKIHFRVSDCVVHDSGALLLRGKDGQLLDQALQRLKISGERSDLPFGSPQALMAAEQSEENRKLSLGPPVELPPVSEGPDFAEGGEPSDSDGEDSKHVDTPPEDDLDPLGTQIGEPLDVSPPLDPWRMADPHEAPATQSKPFRKVVPKAPTRQVAAELTPESFLEALYADPGEVALRRSINQGSIRAPYWPEFITLFVAHLQKTQQTRREQAAKEKNKLQQKLSMLPQMTDKEADDDSDIEDIPVFDVDQADANEWEDEVSVEDKDNRLQSIDELATLTKSYEDACREHVEVNMGKATKFLNETQLSKRISEWQAKLDPKLDAEEHRPPFDIHHYGQQLMGLIVTGTPEIPELTHKQMDFSKAMVGKPRFEVCRYFLAALQLANNENVQLARSTFQPVEDKEDDDVPSMKLALLSLEKSEVVIERRAGAGNPKRPRPKKGAETAPEEKEEKVPDDGKHSNGAAEIQIEGMKISEEKEEFVRKVPRAEDSAEGRRRKPLEEVKVNEENGSIISKKPVKKHR